MKERKEKSVYVEFSIEAKWAAGKQREKRRVALVCLKAAISKAENVEIYLKAGGGFCQAAP